MQLGITAMLDVPALMARYDAVRKQSAHLCEQATLLREKGEAMRLLMAAQCVELAWISEWSYRERNPT